MRIFHKKKYPNLIDQIDEAYKFVYSKKVLPSMRSLQFAGKPIEISPNRLYNCSYLPADSVDAFNEIMFLLLSGCGVGYSVQQHQFPVWREGDRSRCTWGDARHHLSSRDPCH